MWVAIATFALVAVTFCLALYTARLYRATVRLGEDAERTSSRQGIEMAESIRQASLAAQAMTDLASHMAVSASSAQESTKTLRERTALQLRAYLTVTTGTSVYQERYRDTGFQAFGKVKNSGGTPATRVRLRTASQIMNLPIAAAFDFPLPALVDDAGMTLGSGQEMDVWADPLALVPDDEVPEIKAGSGGRALTIWGAVSYDDIFGDPHETRYCHAITWRGNGSAETVFAYYQRQFDGMT
jgi:hypothetical protein